MDFPIENCIIADQCFSIPQVQKLLQYPYLLTYVQIDLKLLEEELSKLGEKKAITCSLSKEEKDLLGTLALAKRRREWLGGRFAAKHATAQLLEQVESQKHDMHWSRYDIIVDKNGRPYLSADNKNAAHLTMPDISISHSGSMAVAMAVQKGFCGVDIQKVTQKVFKVSDRYCSHSEKQILEEFFPVEPEKQAAPLTKLWAAKEALRKVSAMNSLPGYLELELIEITTAPLQKESGPWGFTFNWENSDAHTHTKCTVAVTHLEDYALALTARSNTLG